MGRVYTFRSGLSPDELVCFLTGRLTGPLPEGKADFYCRVFRRGSRVVLTGRTVDRHTRADGWRREHRGWVRGPSRWVGLSNPFVGELVPEGGGCLLRGRFRPHPLIWLMAAVAAGAMLSAVLIKRFSWEERLVGLAAGLWLAWQVFQTFRRPEQGSRELLALLRAHLSQAS